MAFVCPHCVNNFSSKYNLNRHVEQKHGQGYEDEESENEKSESVTSETEKSESDNEDEKSENEESSQSSEESEDSDSYTYDDVRAILRYFSQSNES